MLSPLELKRMAVRIETLQRQRTHGWDNADLMQYKSLLPGGRDRRAVPDPMDLRLMADSGAMPKLRDYQLWLNICMQLEGLVRDNDLRNPKRIMRDMARGRIPRLR